MSSSNFLSVKTHLSEFKSTDKDAASEASSGTTNSMTSAEDLQKLAVILGLNSVEDVYQERFRVDRRRLEAMLAEDLEESQKAQAFFHRVMNETNTLINWPARLKIGARSKKDPHVRVAGRIEDVKLARDKIMQLLDTRSNRVTMKIDVSYTDHSHIIGKGGQTIKRVMEDTGCHIHFPDSNRTSNVEKSNQVSIAGDMERVERARARVRALTPLVFTFELPIVGSSQQMPDINSDYVKQLSANYKVQVSVRTRPKLHGSLVVVKGVQWEVQATMEATTLLLNYMCGAFANQTKIQMTLEISPTHHGTVVGKGAEQLKGIIKGTNTQIMIPDAEDPNIPTIRKSCVTITGNVQDVYTARQQLIGSLPLVLIFDVPQELYKTGQENLISVRYKVQISVRWKPKPGIYAIIIKGIERHAADIYEARRALLGGCEPQITAEIPESYTIPNIAPTMPDFGIYNPFSPQHGNQSPLNPFSIQQLDYGSPMFSTGNANVYPNPISPVALTPPIFSNAWVIPSPPARNAPFVYPGNIVNPNSVIYNQDQNGAWSSIGGGGAPPIVVQPPTSYQTQPKHIRQSALSHMLNASSQASSGYHSNFTGSSASLDTHSISGGESNMVSPSVSPISKTHSPTPSTDTDRSQQELATIISDMCPSERRAVGCEKKTLESMQAKMSPLSAYNQLKSDARKAMQENAAGYRVPTPRWAGNFLSQSSPSAIELPEIVREENNNTPEKWNRSIEKGTPSPPKQAAAGSPCKYLQLYEIIQRNGLAKYVELFKEHELDVATFTTLTEQDLLEVGVTALGARRKMLLLIEDLKMQKTAAYRGSAAPGAERKLSSPQYNLAGQEKW